VFPAPIRPALEAGSYADASAIRRQIEGKGVSAQAFGIYKKVREIDELLRDNPALADILFEVHPEVCFAAWHGSPILAKKATQEGFQKRLALTEPHFGEGTYNQIRSQFRKRDVSNDDILDALAALWTAQRIVTNSAESLPKAELRDAHGIPMRIWC
jgi:predicted RNase H-like nuclease